MKLRKAILLAALPLVIGSVSFMATNQVTAQTNESMPEETRQRDGNGKRRRPDFAAAATQLGVTETALKTALGVPETRPENGQRPPRPDFENAASELGVTEEALKEALGRSKRGGNCNKDGEGENRPRPSAESTI